MQAIYILWLRQIKRHLRSKPRMLGSIAQPIFLLLALGYGFGSVFQRAGQGNYVQFLAPGIIGMSIMFSAIFTGIEIIWDRQFGFLKETLVAPVSRLQIMIGRTLGGGTVATMQGVIVLGLATIAGFRPVSIPAILPSLFIMFLIALLFTSLGTLIASFLDDMQGFQLIMNFLVQPMFFLSGALFPLQGLPGALAIVNKLDPLSYGVDATRALLSGTGFYSLHMSILILSVVTLIFIGLGGYFFSKIEI